MDASPGPPLVTKQSADLTLSETVRVTAEPLVVAWQQATTSIEAIERALYAMADLVSGTIAADGDQLIATVYPRDVTLTNDALAHRLRQEVTDQALRIKIAQRTDPIRNLVFALAFSQSGLGGQPVTGESPTGERPSA